MSSSTPHVRHNREPSEADTDGIEEDYRRELVRRLSAIQDVLEESVGDENNALGLRTNAPDDVEPRETFDFPTTAAKQAAFTQQLQTWLDEGLLEPAGEDAVQRGEHYTANFVRRAYEAGIRFADQHLSRLGIGTGRERDIELAFELPIHRRQLEDLYTRNYSALENVSEDVDESLSEILTRGFSQGYHPRKMARELTNEVEDFQHKRAQTVARTETMHSHNAAAANRFVESGVEQVEILTTDPCDECEALADQNPWPASEAASLVPARTHPNCRCALAPVI